MFAKNYCSMNSQRFKAPVIQSGKRTFIVLPFDPDEVWGTKQRHYVAGLVGGRVVRGALVRENSRFVLPLGAAWRRDNGLDESAEAEVVLTPEGPQGERLPADLATALEATPQARAFFESLATFYRKNYLRWIESAKRPETRAARIGETINLLMAEKKQK